MDTLRADYLSCYRPGKAQTPHIDSLTRNGTLFSQVSSPFPLTLPAHTALLTSTYPFSNGVLDNGVPLSSTAITLATVLKKAGYRTAAFISSFVLDRRFGLNRGFDVYDSPFDLHNKTAVGTGERKRPGAQAAEAATQWLETNSNAPFFLFLHLYDLHAPYDLPPDPSQRHGEKGYAAELVYEDRVIGDFLAALDRLGLPRKTLIVFTSDHGEGLDEHGESSHGYFVYQSTLHVPLIIHWPEGSKRIPQDRDDEPAGLLDVAPTILDAIGISPPDPMRGHSLMASRGNQEVYSESTYARNHFGCATLRSLRLGAYKYIDAPKPELYDLSNDPSELKNLYAQQQSKALALRARIAALRAASRASAVLKPVAQSPETLSALRSLGYLGGSGGSSRVESRVDPKDRIGDFERYIGALTLASAGRFQESDDSLDTLRDRLPDVVDIRTSLGMNLQRLGDITQASREFKRAIQLDKSNAPVHFELGSCYFKLGQRNEAIQQFQAALLLAPWYTRADEALADIYLQAKDYNHARAHLNHLVTVDPESYTAHFNLGVLAAMAQNWTDAQQQLTSALHADPASGEAHYNLALVLQKEGKTEEALRELRAAKDAKR